MKNIKKNKKNCGYIALSTVLITLALILIIGLSVSLLSINDLQSSYSGKIGSNTTDLVESCVEDVLMKLNKNNNISSGTISLLGSTCSVTLNSHVGNIWDFTVSSNIEGFYKNVRVNVTRGTTVTVNSWNDV